ncbi:MAG: DUF4339 domain-containing protein [Phycisphaerales bacterium]|nr:DUF4339 domain-containing protein [Phycisphaerales bacterium]
MGTPDHQEQTWFYRAPNGEQFGPYTDFELRLYADQGRIVGQGHIRHRSSTDWSPAFVVLQEQRVSPRTMNPPIAIGNISGGLSSPTSRVAYILLALLPSVMISIFGVHNLAAGYTGRGIAQLLLSILGVYGLSCLGFVLPPFFCVSVPLYIALLIWVIVESCTVQVDARGRTMR